MSSSEIPYIIGTSPHDALMTSWSVWQECLHMCLVNWTVAVALSGYAKADALVLPLEDGEMVAPDAYHDTYMHLLTSNILVQSYLQYLHIMVIHQSLQGSTNSVT